MIRMEIKRAMRSEAEDEEKETSNTKDSQKKEENPSNHLRSSPWTWYTIHPGHQPHETMVYMRQQQQPTEQGLWT